MADAADPGDPAVDATVDVGVSHDAHDDVSRRDLDLDGHPLPRLAPAQLALWLLRVVVVIVAVAVAFALFALAPPVVVVVPVVLWVLLWGIGLVVFVAAQREGHDSERGLLRLERAAHPRFFAVVDDVCARLSVTTPEALFLINESNAFNARVESRSTIMLGFASLVASDVTALRSTLGHELGHHLADDTTDPALLAWGQLEALGATRWLAFPFAPLARWLTTRTKADTMRRCRLNEHAADFWGGVAAGHDTTAGCLLQDRRASLLWSAVVDDVVVLREAGLRVDDLYRCLRHASRVADEDGFAMMPPSRGTDPLSTHPGDGARADIVEERLRELPRFTSPVHEGGAGVDLFDDDAAIGRDLTDLFFDPDERGEGDWLAVVDDDDLWPRYVEVLPAQLRGAFVAAGHPRLAAPMSSRALFDEVRLLIEAGVRFAVTVHDPALPGLLIPARAVQIADPGGRIDVTWRIVGLLLDLLVADGHLQGTTAFGTIRTVTVGDDALFRVALAARLAHGERWDDLVDQIERDERRHREMLVWASRGFGVGPRWQNPFSSAPSPTTPPTPAWEHDTEEIVLPVRADNSDRERSVDDHRREDDEAPAAE